MTDKLNTVLRQKRNPDHSRGRREKENNTMPESNCTLRKDTIWQVRDGKRG